MVRKKSEWLLLGIQTCIFFSSKFKQPAETFAPHH
jgi:hypothetical protein